MDRKIGKKNFFSKAIVLITLGWIFSLILLAFISLFYDLEKWLWFVHLLILIFMAVGIFWPITKYIARQILKLEEINQRLVKQTEELDRSRLYAFSMMEDAQIAQKEAENGREAVQRLAAIVESSHDAIIGKTLDGIITSWNKGAENLYGYKAQEIIGQSMQKLIPRQEEFTMIMQLLKKGQNVNNLETIRKTKDGRLIYVSLTISLIKDSSGNATGVSIIARDTTQKKKEEDAIRESEERTRAIIQGALDAVIGMDREGTIIYWNLRAEKIFGWSAQEVIGKRKISETIIPLQYREAHERGLKRYFETSQAEVLNKTLEFTALHRSGHEFPVELCVFPIKLKGETAFSAFLRDISERKKAQERFQQVVESAPNGMVMVDEEGNIQLVNKAAEVLFGYSREELREKKIENLIPERFRKMHLGHRQGFSHNMTARAMGAGRDLYGLRKDGTEIPLEIGLNPITIGESHYVLASIVDITERKKSQEQLKQYANALERSNKELEQFAFVASHDLQEPLRIISNYSELWARRYKGKIDGSADKYISYVTQNITRMQHMIQALLEYSRVTRKEEKLQPLSTSKACDQAVYNLKLFIKEKNALISRDELPEIVGSELSMIQLFQNLISNGIKYNKQNQPKVHVSAKKKENNWVFVVEDNGIGLEPAYFDQIFEVFRRLHTADEYPGTGIGLALCKKVVERLGGRIWVESRVGEGSIFYFTIPTHEKRKEE